VREEELTMCGKQCRYPRCESVPRAFLLLTRGARRACRPRPWCVWSCGPALYFRCAQPQWPLRVCRTDRLGPPSADVGPVWIIPRPNRSDDSIGRLHLPRDCGRVSGGVILGSTGPKERGVLADKANHPYTWLFSRRSRSPQMVIG